MKNTAAYSSHFTRLWPAAMLLAGLASSSQPDLARETASFAALCPAPARPTLTCRYEPLPAETHATIYHPAALRGFRLVLGPAAGAAR